MDSQESFEHKCYEALIEKQLRLQKSINSYDKVELQKKKFNLISKLVANLFKYKNSKICYNSISNLISSSLTSLGKDYPIDIHYGKSEDLFNMLNGESRVILEKEVKTDINEYKKILSRGKDFINLIERFSNQYDIVNNIIFCPKIRESNHTPN